MGTKPIKQYASIVSSWESDVSSQLREPLWCRLSQSIIYSTVGLSHWWISTSSGSGLWQLVVDCWYSREHYCFWWRLRARKISPTEETNQQDFISSYYSRCLINFDTTASNSFWKHQQAGTDKVFTAWEAAETIFTKRLCYSNWD